MSLFKWFDRLFRRMVKGRRLWCLRCKESFVFNDDYIHSCPRCGTVLVKRNDNGDNDKLIYGR